MISIIVAAVTFAALLAVAMLAQQAHERDMRAYAYPPYWIEIGPMAELANALVPRFRRYAEVAEEAATVINRLSYALADATDGEEG